MQTLLDLFKIDLGITHNLRDSFFLNLLTATIEEIEKRGITLDLLKTSDAVLVVDYALWTYRNRQQDVDLSRNIQHRLRNRIVEERIAKQNGIV